MATPGPSRRPLSPQSTNTSSKRKRISSRDDEDDEHTSPRLPWVRAGPTSHFDGPDFNVREYFNVEIKLRGDLFKAQCDAIDNLLALFSAQELEELWVHLPRKMKTLRGKVVSEELDAMADYLHKLDVGSKAADPVFKKRFAFFANSFSYQSDEFVNVGSGVVQPKPPLAWGFWHKDRPDVFLRLILLTLMDQLPGLGTVMDRSIEAGRPYVNWGEVVEESGLDWVRLTDKKAVKEIGEVLGAYTLRIVDPKTVRTAYYKGIFPDRFATKRWPEHYKPNVPGVNSIIKAIKNPGDGEKPYDPDSWMGTVDFSNETLGFKAPRAFLHGTESGSISLCQSNLALRSSDPEDKAPPLQKRLTDRVGELGVTVWTPPTVTLCLLFIMKYYSLHPTKVLPGNGFAPFRGPFAPIIKALAQGDQAGSYLYVLAIGQGYDEVAERIGYDAERYRASKSAPPAKGKRKEQRQLTSALRSVDDSFGRSSDPPAAKRESTASSDGFAEGREATRGLLARVNQMAAAQAAGPSGSRGEAHQDEEKAKKKKQKTSKSAIER